MIVLDEQLLGLGLDHQISRWYRGRVDFVISLRPGSVIKDDAIPTLLRRLQDPTFVTINVADFWRRAPARDHCCLVCFALPDSRAGAIPEGLRALLRSSGFRTKGKRMGKVVRVSERDVRFYSVSDDTVQKLSLRCL